MKSHPLNLSETPITINIPKKHQETLEKAAAMRCMTLSEYLLALALDAATQAIPEPEAIIIGEKDWDIITTALENPPEPNEVLKAAFKEYQQQYEQ